MTTEERVEHHLASLRYWAAQLRQLADQWESPELDVRERMAFQVEWDNVIGRLAKVEAVASQGALTATTVSRLRDVADELATLVPTMHRLHLRCPDPDSLARARVATAA